MRWSSVESDRALLRLERTKSPFNYEEAFLWAFTLFLGAGLLLVLVAAIRSLTFDRGLVLALFILLGGMFGSLSLRTSFSRWFSHSEVVANEGGLCFKNPRGLIDLLTGTRLFISYDEILNASESLGPSKEKRVWLERPKYIVRGFDILTTTNRYGITGRNAEEVYNVLGFLKDARGIDVALMDRAGDDDMIFGAYENRHDWGQFAAKLTVMMLEVAALLGGILLTYHIHFIAIILLGAYMVYILANMRKLVQYHLQEFPIDIDIGAEGMRFVTRSGATRALGWSDIRGVIGRSTNDQGTIFRRRVTFVAGKGKDRMLIQVEPKVERAITKNYIASQGKDVHSMLDHVPGMEAPAVWSY